MRAGGRGDFLADDATYRAAEKPVSTHLGKMGRPPALPQVRLPPGGGPDLLPRLHLLRDENRHP